MANNGFNVLSGEIIEAVPLHQPLQGHIIGNKVVGDQQVAPWLAVVGLFMGGGVLAPQSRCVCLGKNGGVVHLISTLGFTEQLLSLCFYNKVGLVVTVSAVSNLEDAFAGLEPLFNRGISFKKAGEPSFRITVELLSRIQTLLKATKEHVSDVALVLDGDFVVAHNSVGGGGERLWTYVAETLADHNFITGSLLPRVLLHLFVNQRTDPTLVKLQDVLDFRLFLQITAQACNELG